MIGGGTCSAMMAVSGSVGAGKAGRGFGSGASMPVVFSMHVTKTFATAEAGVIGLIILDTLFEVIGKIKALFCQRTVPVIESGIQFLTVPLICQLVGEHKRARSRSYWSKPRRDLTGGRIGREPYARLTRSHRAGVRNFVHHQPDAAIVAGNNKNPKNLRPPSPALLQ